MNIGIIIQARLKSTRLPGKVLKELKGGTVLSHVVNRMRNVRNADKVIVATTVEESDDPIYEYAKKNDIQVF
ncbi:cytidylyltransferase domain-containing protein, partial [Rhodovulum adriaticum]|uniref:cytidylyltransferase domain-containing protein n=1 Tax=Rhodovulum adriaticum TaxID=35804 RepID=UPI002D7D2D1E|nr:acylneuraminate cytidylyltransferase [Rhodovulum adriaticum]